MFLCLIYFKKLGYNVIYSEWYTIVLFCKTMDVMYEWCMNGWGLHQIDWTLKRGDGQEHQEQS